MPNDEHLAATVEASKLTASGDVSRVNILDCTSVERWKYCVKATMAVLNDDLL